MERLAGLRWQLFWRREGLAIAGVLVALVLVGALTLLLQRRPAPRGPEVRSGATIVTFHQVPKGKTQGANLLPLSIDVELRLDDGTTEYVVVNGASVAGCHAGEHVTVFGVAVRPDAVQWRGLAPGGCVTG